MDSGNRSASSFNPLPAFRPGDTVIGVVASPGMSVFQSTPGV